MEDRPVPLAEAFVSVDDPRIQRSRRHNLIDILVISVCAVLCGADGWEDISLFARTREPWLRTFLALPGGIPSPDTIRRLFERISPQSFQQAFTTWIASVSKTLGNEIVSIDGKTLRRSFDKSADKNPIVMVSAWAGEQGLVLGQHKVDDKSNEITAIPYLLELLEIKGCIVTIDAMGCQKEIANKIISQGGDYVLALKGNQGTFHDEVKLHFDGCTPEILKSKTTDFLETIDGGHGRIEVRRYWITDDLSFLDPSHQWAGLKSIGICEATREIGAKVSTDRRYFISSLPAQTAAFSRAVRNHWGIENSLHWVLDVTFREDNSRIRKGYSPQNFSILRHIALNLLRSQKRNPPHIGTKKLSIRKKRLLAGWEPSYLLSTIFGSRD